MSDAGATRPNSKRAMERYFSFWKLMQFCIEAGHAMDVVSPLPPPPCPTPPLPFPSSVPHHPFTHITSPTFLISPHAEFLHRLHPAAARARISRTWDDRGSLASTGVHAGACIHLCYLLACFLTYVCCLACLCVQETDPGTCLAALRKDLPNVKTTFSEHTAFSDFWRQFVMMEPSEGLTMPQV